MYHFEGGAVQKCTPVSHTFCSLQISFQNLHWKELYPISCYLQALAGGYSRILGYNFPKKNDYDKRLSEYSSGMTQRVKLATAILSNVPLVYCLMSLSFLDASSKKWFVDLLSSYKMTRIIVIASNDPFD